MVCVKTVWLICIPVAHVSVAVIVKLNVPAADGVPDIRPPVLKFNPGGSVPLAMEKETGGCPPEDCI